MKVALFEDEIAAPEPVVVDVMRRLADGSLDESGLAAWIRSVTVSCGT